MTEDSYNTAIMLEKVLRTNGIHYTIGLELGNPEAIKRCVMAGSGIALLPRMAAEEEIKKRYVRKATITVILTSVWIYN